MTTPDVAGLLEGEPAHDQVVFATRLQRYWPDLLAGLAGAYPDQAVEMAGRAAEIAATSFRRRPEDLRLLDLRRHADPQWHQHPRMLGYAAYTDMFAGNLRGVIDKIDYLAELGVTYLHLMPLLKPREDRTTVAMRCRTTGRSARTWAPWTTCGTWPRRCGGPASR